MRLPGPVFFHPPIAQLVQFDGPVVTLPHDKAQRAAFLRDVAPTIEVGAGAGGNVYPPDFMDAAKNLKLICCVGSGHDGYDPQVLLARGIRLTNAPGLNAGDVADMTVGLILSTARCIAAADAAIRAGKWRIHGPVRSMKGRKVGIVGLGLIGHEVAARLKPFGVELAWTGPRPKPEAPYPYVASLHELAQWADILVATFRADAQTRHLIDRSVIDALGPQGMLVNITRGIGVDEAALIAALKEGRLGSAALDVFENEPTDPEIWRDVPNTTLTPHLGGATTDSLRAGGAMLRENIRRFYAGEPLLNALN